MQGSFWGCGTPYNKRVGGRAGIRCMLTDAASCRHLPPRGRGSCDVQAAHPGSPPAWAPLHGGPRLLIWLLLAWPQRPRHPVGRQPMSAEGPLHSGGAGQQRSRRHQRLPACPTAGVQAESGLTQGPREAQSARRGHSTKLIRRRVRLLSGGRKEDFSWMQQSTQGSMRGEMTPSASCVILASCRE